MNTQLVQKGEPLPWQTSRKQHDSAPENISKQIEKMMPLNNMQGFALRAYVELLKLKNYSPNTISNYRNWFTPLD